MTNLEKIKNKLVFFLDKQGVPQDFLSAGMDVVLDAINEARLKAEQSYAFEFNKRLLFIPSVIGPRAWTKALEVFEPTQVRQVRSIKKLYLANEKNQIQEELPLEYRSLQIGHIGSAAIVGEFLILPENLSQANVVFDGYVWMDEYISYDQEDWMLQHGSNYLFWASLQILNFKVKEFVPRQEGNLTLTDEFIRKELASLIVWDTQLKHGSADILNA